MKGVLGIALLSVIISGMFFACQKSKQASDDGKIKIVVGTWPKPSNEVKVKFLEKKMADLSVTNPEIVVIPDNWVYDINSFLPKAESGQLPNVYQTYFTEPQKIIQGGYAADITDAMKKYGYDKAYNPEILEMVTHEGRYYGIPESGYVLGLQYNVTVMKEAGLVDENGVPFIPETWDELAEMASTVKKRTGKPGFFLPGKGNQGGWIFTNIAWGFGTEFVKFVDGKWIASFNSPEGLAALSFYSSLKWKYDALQDSFLADVGDGFRLLGTDQVAMAFGTYEWRNTPIIDYEASRHNYAYSALPAGPAGRYSLMGGSLWMVSPESTPEQIDAIFKWLEIYGVSPKKDEATMNALREQMESDVEAGFIAGPSGLNVWADHEKVAKEKAIREEYANIDLKLWRHYIDNASSSLHPEVPVATQELYKLLDGVVQAALSEKNADLKALLEKAAADFQSQYLDALN